jgi:hypothetical protein
VNERGQAPYFKLKDFNLIPEGRKKMSFNKITIVGYLGRDPELRVRHEA